MLINIQPRPEVFPAGAVCFLMAEVSLSTKLDKLNARKVDWQGWDELYYVKKGGYAR
jgi:hypothetical protein